MKCLQLTDFSALHHAQYHYAKFGVIFAHKRQQQQILGTIQLVSRTIFAGFAPTH